MASQKKSDNDIIPMGKAIAIIVSVVVSIIVLLGGGVFVALTLSKTNTPVVLVSNNREIKQDIVQNITKEPETNELTADETNISISNADTNAYNIILPELPIIATKYNREQKTSPKYVESVVTINTINIKQERLNAADLEFEATREDIDLRSSYHIFWYLNWQLKDVDGNLVDRGDITFGINDSYKHTTGRETLRELEAGKTYYLTIASNFNMDSGK